LELFVAAIVTIAEADEVVLAWDVAVTITVAWGGTVAGAVNSPLEEIVPQLDPEQPGPLTLQVTAVFVVPETASTNCCVPLTVTRALVGDIVTATGERIVTVAEAAV
jgi:hypothetical protein